jgi:superfamily I DNA/RNA helicase
MLWKARPGTTPKAPLCAIVIDETQDFGPQALKLLRAMISAGSNDLFFVGDGHQRIYSRNRASMGKCGIDIRGRSRKLYLNYRTTDEIRRHAVALLEGCDIDDLDDGHDENRRYKSLSHGPAPSVAKVSDVREAAEHIKKFHAEFTADGQRASFCAIAPTEKIRDALAAEFQRSGRRCLTIDAQSNHSDSQNVIHLATMHRAKGLEFDAVAVVTPVSYLGPPDKTINQRRLLYVALTRAKRAAIVVELD